MAGHNKWSKVKRLKAVIDKRKGAAFTKLIKEIMVAARAGKDPDSNPRLRKAIIEARQNSVPKDNIERAIKKGSGELDDGSQIEELTYEGIAPGGVGLMVECLSDNRLRTQPELRKIFEKAGGMIGEMGSVGWAFQKMGIILISREAISEDQLTELVLQAGADDLKVSDDGFEIFSTPNGFEPLRHTIEKAGIKMELSEVTFIPTSKVPVSTEIYTKIEELVDGLEEHDDVQRVSHNAEMELP